MSNKITNPFLKQLISGIASNANSGRITDISWGTLAEAKKNKKSKVLKREAVEKKPGEEDAAAQPQDQGAPDAQPTEQPQESPSGAIGNEPPQQPDTGGDNPDAPTDAPAGDAPAGGDSAPEESPEEAEADATKAKAELEKAKAEKDQAEQEIENQSYVKLDSGPGTQYLLGKILNHAFKTNTIDALAGEMSQKLKIQTPEDMALFSNDVAPYRVLPGMGELLTSMNTMVTKSDKNPAADQETPAE